MLKKDYIKWINIYIISYVYHFCNYLKNILLEIYIIVNYSYYAV